jgi:hypothetical protein
MLQRSVILHNLRATTASGNIFILTTEIIRGYFSPVPANLPGRPSRADTPGRI